MQIIIGQYCINSVYYSVDGKKNTYKVSEFPPKKNTNEMLIALCVHICNRILYCAGGVSVQQGRQLYKLIIWCQLGFLKTKRCTETNPSFNYFLMPNYWAIFEDSKKPDPCLLSMHCTHHPRQRIITRHQTGEILHFPLLYDICIQRDGTLLPN